MCDISKCIREIRNALKSGKVIFFVGTGISYDPPSNIPLADDVTNNVLYLLCQENDKLQNWVFEKKNPTTGDTPEGIIGVYRKIAECVENSLGKGYSEKHGYERWKDKEKKKSIRMEVLLLNESIPNKYHSLRFLEKSLRILEIYKKKSFDYYLSCCMVLINIGRDLRRKNI